MENFDRIYHTHNPWLYAHTCACLEMFVLKILCYSQDRKLCHGYPCGVGLALSHLYSCSHIFCNEPSFSFCVAQYLVFIIRVPFTGFLFSDSDSVFTYDSVSLLLVGLFPQEWMFPQGWGFPHLPPLSLVHLFVDFVLVK